MSMNHQRENIFYQFFIFFLGHLEVVKILIEHKYGSNINGDGDFNPLFDAAKAGKEMIFSQYFLFIKLILSLVDLKHVLISFKLFVI